MSASALERQGLPYSLKSRHYQSTTVTLMLGLHGDILEIRVENIADIVANCLCVNRVDSSVAGIL
jgi:hypothetical protein